MLYRICDFLITFSLLLQEAAWNDSSSNESCPHPKTAWHTAATVVDLCLFVWSNCQSSALPDIQNFLKVSLLLQEAAWHDSSSFGCRSYTRLPAAISKAVTILSVAQRTF